MLQFTSKFGKHLASRLRQEQIIWLTTVAPDGTPQPVPVWFHWDGQTILLFSERNKPKLCNIASNPRVSFNLNTDEEGGEVAVLIGEAVVLKSLPEPARLDAFVKKYKQGIKDVGLTEEQFKKDYSVPVLFTPKSMRGF